MNIKPMLSMDVIKKYIDNFDKINNDSLLNISEFHKQAMTSEEIKTYKKNFENINKVYGELEESGGGIRRLIKD